MESIVEKYDPNKVFLTKGAKTRHRSILQGLECLKSILQLDKCEKDPVVIIHDGVRPFVDEKTILDVIDNTTQYKAVGVVR
uniref:2-C-methyl-D-erythritol 4-phosphate cytidylyltransferase n=1 Tax=Ciona savignyi TaxID=51511 RepID=H2ZF72_CIOSA